MLKVQEFQELSGIQYVMCDIACKHDKAYEKKHWNERIAHFKEIDFDNPKSFSKASNPVGMRAACIAYDTFIAEQPSGYMISLDAASSGMQLLSILISCPISWKLCGGDENILDSYTHIYTSMGVSQTLKRNDIKQSIMTSLYGSVATPQEIFGDDIDLFYKTMEHMAPGAWDLNLGLQELWNEIQGTSYDWYMPDGFYACIETTDKEIIPFTFLDETYKVVQSVNERPRFHKGLGPNLVHSIDGMIVREMMRRCQFDSNVTARVADAIVEGKQGTNGKSKEMVQYLWANYLESGFLSCRILDYLFYDTIGLVDPLVIAKLIQSMPDKSFQLVTVHDCFRCHPNYGNDVRKQYNIIMADLNDSKILPYMVQQLCGNKVSASKVGSIPRDVILNGNYLLS